MCCKIANLLMFNPPILVDQLEPKHDLPPLYRAMPAVKVRPGSVLLEANILYFYTDFETLFSKFWMSV
jgi:hypothetical protein